jgi:UDP-N-acetylglucosamine--N-acetylmuramyl-(pentapeptide) pyrophosphoryl-undecaprenol N-acetylglucosamine transferase
MRLALTGGGTGGHVYPAIAIAEAFAREKDFTPLRVLFIGTKDRMEAQIVPKAGLDIEFVRAAPLERKLSAQFFTMLVTNAVGFIESLGALRDLQPDVLIATGGYVALPVVAAARFARALGLLGTRIAVLEPNAVAGLANRLLSPLVDEIWYSIGPAGRTLTAREFVVGTPVRSSIRRSMEPAQARKALKLDPERVTIVAMGGSLGASSINAAVADYVVAGLPADWQLLLVAGEREQNEMWRRLGWRDHVKVIPYIDDPRLAYAAADMFVSRAGASTIGELAATATPALLVPYPHATGDHQMANARAYAAGGAARVIPDGELDAGRLRLELTAALGKERLDAMRTAAQRGALADARAAIVARVKTWPIANTKTP